MRKAEIASLESLTKAFAGQDAVVSTVAVPVALSGQDVITDAAVAAGVKRFIPSEFGHSTLEVPDPALRSILSGKTAAISYIVKKSKENPSFTWTGLATSLFLDWVSTCCVYRQAKMNVLLIAYVGSRLWRTRHQFQGQDGKDPGLGQRTIVGLVAAMGR